MRKILVILMLIFAFGCKEDVTAPSERMLYGSWIRANNSDLDKEIEFLYLQFGDEGELAIDIRYLDSSVKYIIGNYIFKNNKLTIKSEECEDVEGVYKVNFIDNGVKFVFIDDKCQIRDYIDGYFENPDNIFDNLSTMQNDVREKLLNESNPL